MPKKIHLDVSQTFVKDIVSYMEAIFGPINTCIYILIAFLCNASQQVMMPEELNTHKLKSNMAGNCIFHPLLLCTH